VDKWELQPSDGTQVQAARRLTLLTSSS